MSHNLSQDEVDMSRVLNDVALQVAIPGKATIFVARQIYLVARHSFYVALEVTLYHDWKTSRCCNRDILVWITMKYCDMLHHFCCFRAVYCKTLIPSMPMSYYVLNIKRRHNHYQTSQSYSPAARSSMQEFGNDFDVIFMLKI